FAQKITGRSKKDTEYTYAWTAISRPPFLTALALWPKGDCWHGAGCLRTEESFCSTTSQAWQRRTQNTNRIGYWSFPILLPGARMTQFSLNAWNGMAGVY